LRAYLLVTGAGLAAALSGCGGAGPADPQPSLAGTVYVLKRVDGAELPQPVGADEAGAQYQVTLGELSFTSARDAVMAYTLQRAGDGGSTAVVRLLRYAADGLRVVLTPAGPPGAVVESDTAVIADGTLRVRSRLSASLTAPGTDRDLEYVEEAPPAP
jgi:hypothetical protein